MSVSGSRPPSLSATGSVRRGRLTTFSVNRVLSCGPALGLPLLVEAIIARRYSRSGANQTPGMPDSLPRALADGKTVRPTVHFSSTARQPIRKGFVEGLQTSDDKHS